MTQSWHLQKVSLPEIESEWDGKVKRTVPQVIVVVLVLIDSLHQGYRIANATLNLVKYETRALIQNEGVLSIFYAVSGDHASDHEHCVK